MKEKGRNINISNSSVTSSEAEMSRSTVLEKKKMRQEWLETAKVQTKKKAAILRGLGEKSSKMITNLDLGHRLIFKSCLQNVFIM